MRIIHRRRVLAGLSLTGAAALIGAPKLLHAEAPPETTTVRIAKYTGPAVCEAPKYVAAELLRAEGFTDVRYVEHGGEGDLDFDTGYPSSWINWTENPDYDEPWAVLTGLHSGCLQLIANDSIGTILDLRGKRVGAD